MKISSFSKQFSSVLALLSILSLSACDLVVGSNSQDPNYSNNDSTNTTRSFELKQVYTIRVGSQTENHFFLASTLENSPIYSLVKIEMWDADDRRRIDVTDRFVGELPVSSATLVDMNNRNIINATSLSLIEKNQDEVAYFESNRLSSLAPSGTSVMFYFTFLRTDGSQTTQQISVMIF